MRIDLIIWYVYAFIIGAILGAMGHTPLNLSFWVWDLILLIIGRIIIVYIFKRNY